MTIGDIFLIIALCVGVFNCGIVVGAWYVLHKQDDEEVTLDDTQH
jgi:hypothetical protein